MSKDFDHAHAARPQQDKKQIKHAGRDVIRLTIDDLSQFTKTLRKQLEAPPSHVEMLTHVARAAGYKNFQHLRDQNQPEPQANRKQVDRAARYFDAQGQWTRWPLKRGVRELCLWVIWAGIPARQTFNERQISAVIDEMTLFHDPAQIRRSLVEMDLMTRDIDGSNYQRLEQPMPPEARALLDIVKDRRQSR